MCKFCDGYCTCHINPPCSFCESHIECKICGQQVCKDQAVELKNDSDGSYILVCPDCAEVE